MSGANGERPAEPFLLLTRNEPQDGPVTNEQLSEQIGALSSHVQVVHREVALARDEVADLRGLVLDDHAQRITAVEKRVPITIPPGAKVAGKYGAIALAIPAALQVVAALKPGLAGPLQTIIQLFGGSP